MWCRSSNEKDVRVDLLKMRNVQNLEIRVEGKFLPAAWLSSRGRSDAKFRALSLVLPKGDAPPAGCHTCHA